MSWIALVTNPGAIEHIFGSPPPLKDVQINEMVYHEDGPRLLLRFDVSTFPAKPPEKWVAQGFNRAQIRLMCVGIHHLEQRGWGTCNKVDIDISAELKQVRLRTTKGQPALDVLCDALTIDGVSGYVEGHY